MGRIDIWSALTGSPLSYAAVAASIAGSAVFPPLPSEGALATAMGLAAAGRLHLGWVCLAAAAGALAGDLAAYGLGRTLSGRAHRRAGRSRRVGAALRWLEEHEHSWGVGLVIGGRFVPGGTMAVGLSAGVLRYPVRLFLPAAAAGALIWTGYGAGLGFLGRAVFPGNAWAGVALALACTAVAGGAAHLWHRRRRRRLADAPAPRPLDRSGRRTGSRQ